MKEDNQYISKDHLFLLTMLGFWILLGLVELLRGGISAMASQRSFDSYRALSFVTSYILAWFILTYPILLFFNKTSRVNWLLKIIFHLVFSILFGYFHYLFNSLFFAFFMRQEQSLLEYMETGPIQLVPFALNAALIYWVVIFLLLILDYYHKYKEEAMHSSRLETQLAQSKLQALRMQLHPHFLFNALNTISMLVRKKKDKDATKMISSLSDMLRTALTQTERSMIRLEEELSLLSKYLDLEQIRFEDTLHIIFDIDDSALDCRVPSLILQPLVENAFKHGISRQIDNSKLCISAKKNNRYLTIKIFNTGPELPPEWNIRKNVGVGLNNTIGRLDTLYGNNYSLQIDNREEKGVQVKLKLPINHQ